MKLSPKYPLFNNSTESPGSVRFAATWASTCLSQIAIEIIPHTTHLIPAQRTRPRNNKRLTSGGEEHFAGHANAVADRLDEISGHVRDGGVSICVEDL